MAHRVPESFDGLTGKGTSRGIGNGAGDHDTAVWPESQVIFTIGFTLVFVFFYGENSRLAVERVKNSFDEQYIAATINQTTHLCIIGVNQVIKSNGAVAGIVHIGREGCGTVG